MNVERKICWRITRRCNIHCLHCLAGFKNAERRDLSAEEQFQAISKVSEAGVTRITWTGGEPTLAASLPALLELSHQQNITTVLTTNGLSLTQKVVSALSRTTDSIRVSLDGLEKTHNEIRGGPFFYRTMSTITRLVTFGFKTEVNISVMQRNVEEIPKLLEIVKAAGVSKVVLLTLMQRESAIKNNLSPGTRNQLAALHAEVATFQEANPSMDIILYDYDDPYDTYIVVESDGEIVLCSELADRGMGQLLAPNGTELLNAALADQTLAHTKPVLQLQQQ
jgi:Fe-coproporphyrin III synthase